MTRCLVIMIAAGCVLMSGCEGPPHARESALALAAYTSSVQAQVARFEVTQASIDNARRRNIDLLEASALEIAAENGRDLEILRLTSSTKKTAEVFDAIIAASDRAAASAAKAATAREEALRRTSTTRAKASARIGKLAATSKSLAQLGEEVDLEGQVRFLVGFFRDVKKKLDELEKSDDADDTKKAAETETNKAVTKGAKSRRQS